LQLHITTIL